MSNLTHRYYNPVSPDVQYQIDEFNKSCRALGLKINLWRCTSQDFTPQGEAIYTREKEPIEGYCLIDDYIPSQSGQVNEEYAETPLRGSKILYIPMVYGDEEFRLTQENFLEGSLVEILDDMNIEGLEFGTYILEDIMPSPDRIYWECRSFIQRTENDEQNPDPGGSKTNFSLLKK